MSQPCIEYTGNRKARIENNLSFSFVLLAYRRSDDVDDCLSSISRRLGTASYSAIVVDSYYDDIESARIRDVAEAHSAAYVSIANKGYSYGNNVGILHALDESRKSDFIVVCNPDTELKKLDETSLALLVSSLGHPSETPYIIAPKIETLNGKYQNPSVPSKSELYEKLIYWGFKTQVRALCFAGFALNRLKRELFLAFHSRQTCIKIYEPHGSCIIFSRKAAEILAPVFDEQMFLFAEEHLLAWRAAKKQIPVLFCPEIEVLHKEDGSVGLLGKTNDLMRKSNIYVYEKTHNIV